jgi:hypothetical protein
MLNSQSFLTKSKEQSSPRIAIDFGAQRADCDRMRPCENLAVGASVAGISKLAVVKVELPPLTFGAMLDV